MKKKFLSAVLAAALLAVAGCAENGAARSADTEETAKPEPEINTELLSEFGMTFAELEEKYGKAVSAEVTEGADYTDVLYFFESSSGGYGFVAEETDMSEITLPDGSPQVKEGAEFKYFNGKAENLFLGMEDATTTEEIEKAYGVDVYSPNIKYHEFYTASFVYESNYLVHTEIENHGIIEPNSALWVTYYPEGVTAW